MIVQTVRERAARIRRPRDARSDRGVEDRRGRISRPASGAPGPDSTTAASITSRVPASPHGCPAARARRSSRGSTIAMGEPSRRARRAWRMPLRQTRPTTPAGTDERRAESDQPRGDYNYGAVVALERDERAGVEDEIRSLLPRPSRHRSGRKGRPGRFKEGLRQRAVVQVARCSVPGCNRPNRSRPAAVRSARRWETARRSGAEGLPFLILGKRKPWVWSSSFFHGSSRCPRVPETTLSGSPDTRD